MTLPAQRALSIKDLSLFLNQSQQTLRAKLKRQGYLSSPYKIGNEYRIPIMELEPFIANSYSIYYNDFVNGYLGGNKSEVLMFQIPKGKGVISCSTQRSGQKYYYIRNLPLYIDDKGNIVNYRSKGFTSKDDAEAERRKMIADRDNGLYKYRFLEDIHSQQVIADKIPSESTQSYYDFCIDFFTKAVLSEATRKLYLSITENRIKPYFHNIPIHQLSKGLLQSFVDQYSTNIRKTFIVLRKTLSKLYSLDLIPTNYSECLIKPTSTAPKYPKEALSVEETKQFLSHYEGHQLEHCMLLLFNCGLRIGELQALQWHEIEFIDESKARIHINASWGETPKGMARKSPKTRSSTRIIPINSTYMVSVLKKAKNASKGQLWVAENQTGLRPLDKHNFSKRYFTKVGLQLGFKKHLSSHVARHTFISNLVQNNVPYTEIAKLAGHNSTAMIINVYAHAIQDESTLFSHVANLYT